MKLIPWTLVLALSVALVLLLMRDPAQPEASGERDALLPPPLPTLSGQTKSGPAGEVTLSSDAIQELTEEIRGLREDLRSLLAEEREPVGENELTTELRRLVSALEQRASVPTDRGPVSVSSMHKDVNEPVILDLHERTNSDYEATKRAFILRSQQEILDDFGVPRSIIKNSTGSVTWGYRFETPDGEGHYVGITFIDGAVSEISASR